MKYGHLSYKNAQKTISIIAYADDFVILHESEEVVLKAKVLAGKWLKTIGLKLSLSKTKIKHTLKSLNIEKPGFDFLGFTIRHYPRKRHKRPYKLIINPSCKSVKQHTLDIKQRLKRMLGIT